MTLLDESVLRRLMTNPLAVREFPFLEPPRVTTAACCGRSVSVPQPDFNALKRTIVGLPPERRARLLALAGLAQARVVYQDGKKTWDARI
jgi:hypothetical protein